MRKIDYQCLHWYDVGFGGLQTYLEENHDTFGLPIILTEFADQVLSRALCHSPAAPSVPFSDSLLYI